LDILFVPLKRDPKISQTGFDSSRKQSSLLAASAILTSFICPREESNLVIAYKRVLFYNHLVKFETKIKARKLREKGLSYKEILEEINISKSTLSIWLREIELTPDQKKRLTNKMDRVRYEVAKRKVAQRIERTKYIIKEAKTEAKTFLKNPMFLTGISLYWAEGAKNPKESVRFSNSDEAMVRLIMKWFRGVCGVPEEKFRVHVHIHNLHSRKNVCAFWSKVTGIPLKQFYKTYIKSTSLGQRKNVLYNGTCSIVVNDRKLFRKIMGWKLGLQEYFGVSPL